MNDRQKLRDRGIEGDLAEVLANDLRLKDLAVTVKVRGGVVHLSGTIASERQRELLRRMIGMLDGVLGVWDLVRVGEGSEPVVVDLGCGDTKQSASALGVDHRPHVSVDIVADMTAGLPLPDDSVDHAFAVHVLEHVHDLIGVLREIHRILKPTGVLHVMTPEWRFVNAVADPTHVRFFSVQTFKYFCCRHPESSGIPVFWPLAVHATVDTVFADLRAVKDGEVAPDGLLARYFD